MLAHRSEHRVALKMPKGYEIRAGRSLLGGTPASSGIITDETSYLCGPGARVAAELIDLLLALEHQDEGRVADTAH
jgi:hypothetical protein